MAASTCTMSRNGMDDGIVAYLRSPMGPTAIIDSWDQLLHAEYTSQISSRGRPRHPEM